MSNPLEEKILKVVRRKGVTLKTKKRPPVLKRSGELKYPRLERDAITWAICETERRSRKR